MLMDGDFGVVGIAAGAHKQFEYMVAIALSVDYIDGNVDHLPHVEHSKPNNDNNSNKSELQGIYLSSSLPPPPPPFIILL